MKLPTKELYSVQEVSRALSVATGKTFESTKRAIYRQIENGSIRSTPILNTAMLSRDEVSRVFGEVITPE